jgi:hypothetical protein
MFLNSRGNELWDTMKETVNFLSSTKAGTGGSKGEGNGDVRGAIEGD